MDVSHFLITIGLSGWLLLCPTTPLHAAILTPAGQLHYSVSAAPVQFSRAVLDTPNDSVHLVFTGLVEPNPDASHFTLAINGLAVEVAGVGVLSNAVSVLLPPNSLQAGDVVTVNWRGLHTATGAAIADGQWQGKAS